MGASTNIYSTGFEVAEGYNSSLDLVGQNDWIGSGSGGNGLVTSVLFPGFGQLAYIGYSPPIHGSNYLYVWRPIDLSPVPANKPVVKFSVLMAIVDSSNGQYDDFYWSAYNVQGDPLFTLDFDNYSTNILYALGTNFFPTGKTFTPNTRYTLVVTMDFSANRWAATLDDMPLVADQPIAGPGVSLNLGDVDAVWFIYNPNAPGNNYLLFDNYQIMAESVPGVPPRLSVLGSTGDGQFLLRLSGTDGARYAIDGTTNLLNWTSLKTNLVSDSYFDYVDSSAPGFPRRFYRARFVP